MSKKRKDPRIVPANVFANRMADEAQRLNRLIAEREERLRREAADQLIEHTPRITYYPPRAAERTDRRLYFAYGSNLCPGQMMARCPGAVRLYPLDLDGFKLEFQRHANIVETGDTSGSVSGAVYLIPPEDEAKLDRFEGVHNGSYIKKTFKFFTPKNNWRNVLYYQKKPGRLVPPSPHYLRTILSGYKYWGLDTGKLTAAVTEANLAEAEYMERFRQNLDQPLFEADDDMADWIVNTQLPTMSLAELKELAEDPTWDWSEAHIKEIAQEIARKKMQRKDRE